jgi:hypothetical protein
MLDGFFSMLLVLRPQNTFTCSAALEGGKCRAKARRYMHINPVEECKDF